MMEMSHSTLSGASHHSSEEFEQCEEPWADWCRSKQRSCPVNGGKSCSWNYCIREEKVCWNVRLSWNWCAEKHIFWRGLLAAVMIITVFLAEKEQGLLYLNFRMRSRISRFFDKLWSLLEMVLPPLFYKPQKNKHLQKGQNITVKPVKLVSTVVNGLALHNIFGANLWCFSGASSSCIEKTKIGEMRESKYEPTSICILLLHIWMIYFK